MQKIAVFIGLHMRLQWGKDVKSDKKGQISSLIIGLITCAVLLVLLKYFLDVLLAQFSANIAPADVSTLLITVVSVVLVFFGVSMQVKYLLKPFDIVITARFPMSSFQMFLAQTTMVYIYMQILAFVMLTPVMLIFGWSAHLLTGAYVGRILLAVILTPMLPFVLATFLAIPTMFVLTLLENHNFIKLTIFIAALVGTFVLYNYILNILANYYIHQRLDQNTLDIWSRFIGALNAKYNPFILIKGIVFNQAMGKCVLCIALFLTGGVLAGYSAAKPVYDRVRIKSLEGNRSAFNKKTKITSDNAVSAIIKKEFKEIMRTHTYAYFYLGVAITTPVMVFLCDRLVEKVGEAQLGSLVSFGVSAMVIMIFMSMINSFSASAISREDKAFYITKIIPVDFRKQLLAKGILNFAVSVGALLISLIILATLEFVSPLQIGVILIAALVGTVGLIANGFNINLRHPNIGSKTNGEINEINVTRMLFIGLLFSGIEGFMALVLSFLLEQKFVYVIVTMCALLYAVINIVIFLTTANKKYSSIEYK